MAQNKDDTDHIWVRDEGQINSPKIKSPKIKSPKIKSPCVKICVIDRSHKHCLGCYRTREEIASWAALSPEARDDIMDALETRKTQLKPKRKSGRRAQASS